MEKGSFQKSPFSRGSREFGDSRVSRELPDCGKERRFRPFSRDSREFRDFRDSRDFSSEKTPFVMTPFSGPENWKHTAVQIGGNLWTQLSGTQFDKRTTRYEYWEVLSPPSLYFNRESVSSISDAQPIRIALPHHDSKRRHDRYMILTSVCRGFVATNGVKSLSRLLSRLLGGRFGFCLISFFSGEGKGESEAPGGGVGFLLKIAGERGGGFSQEGKGGAEGPGGCLWRVEGARLNFFFGSKFPPRLSCSRAGVHFFVPCFQAFSSDN